jgi:broad specificity phosphatase PhoE
VTAVRAVMLVRHAGTLATRRGDFPLDEPLSEDTKLDAVALGGCAEWGAPVFTSPARRAVQTAEAAEWSPLVDSRLCALDLGSWGGRSLRSVQSSDPEGFLAWMTDPQARPHDGETVAELFERVRPLLDEWHSGPRDDLVAVTHGSVIRAAVTIAMDAPATSFWRVEASPASVTELHTRGSGWVLYRTNQHEDV